MCSIFILCCSNSVPKELTLYVNVELPKIVAKEVAIGKSYESVTGPNYRNDATTLSTLRNDVIPKYKDFITDLQTISTRLKTSELRELHKIYIDAANTQYSGFMLVVSGLEKQDGSILSQANENLHKSHKLMREWLIELQTLCEQNGVTLIPPTI